MTIEDVLAAHDGIGYDDIDGCQCGAEFGSHDAHRTNVADAIRNHLVNEAQKFDPSDDYHQNRPDEDDLNAHAYYAGIDRVCALIEGRIDSWTALAAATNTHQEQP